MITERMKVLQKILPGNEYTLIETGIIAISFVVVPHAFSPQFIVAAAEEWRKKPGKYDNTLTGFRRIKRNGTILHIEAVPVLYSQHRYITKCIIENVPISENDCVLVAGVVNLSHIVKKGKKYFLFGLKKSGNLGAGRIEIIPQGFCDFDPLKKTTRDYVARAIKNEMEEEVSPKTSFKTFSYLGLATDDNDKQYAVLTECCIQEAEEVLAFVNNASNHTKEHDAPILVSEDELYDLVSDTAQLLHLKTGLPLQDNVLLGATTKAALYLYLKRQKPHLKSRRFL